MAMKAFVAEDQDRGRPFGNFQRLDRRQMDADPYQHADDRDYGPQCQHRAPINQPADTETPLAAAPRFTGCSRPALAAAGAAMRGTADAIRRPQAQIEALGVARPLASLAPRHIPPSARIMR
jgi:hypothetical protein